jgi:hypothetical protein
VKGRIDVPDPADAAEFWREADRACAWETALPDDRRDQRRRDVEAIDKAFDSVS